MLSGPEIRKKIAAGEIIIDPFDDEQINPNSYDLRLAKRILTYKIRDAVPLNMMDQADAEKWPAVLDMQKMIDCVEEEISEDGYTMYPGRLYLGSTVESTFSPKHVPQISGKSSIARYGVAVHITAGFGDAGFKGHWTLEMTTVHPVKIYPELRIAQVYFTTVEGDIMPYQGRYQNQPSRPIASRMAMGQGNSWKDNANLTALRGKDSV